jgi:DeoR family fructose operon transcriptional repressor
MYQKERLDNILQLVKQYGYVTVKYLVSTLHYSNATINRDLNALVAQKKVRRSYGGVEYIEKKGVPLPFRYDFMRSEKLKIGKKAAEFIRDGDTVFIDASTTTECMAEFLVEKKDLTVITNNMALVMHLSEYGIKTVCLGGKVIEPPCMLDGEDTVENAMKYQADKMFFATGYVSEDGRIGEGTYGLLHTVMAQNSKEIYYLADHEILDEKHLPKRYLFDFSNVKGVISDYEFSKEIKRKYSNTQFYKV